MNIKKNGMRACNKNKISVEDTALTSFLKREKNHEKSVIKRFSLAMSLVTHHPHTSYVQQF